ncbi:MAG: ATP-binding protein [Youngiibacter sp.]|nr:ATP-binding protein [Youngiibacter sp.]
MSSFSNQDDGGIILFGVDEKSGFLPVGVYDPHDLQRKVTEQCNQMVPVVRPIFTVADMDGMQFVSAEIPAVDLSERPFFYGGKGCLRGAYIRGGDNSLTKTRHMTEVLRYSCLVSWWGK